MWEQLTAEESEGGRCASMNCGSEPLVRFIAGGVGSTYCAPCARRVERMRIRSIETNRQIDELEAEFGLSDLK